jgi:hypothetical protein
VADYPYADAPEELLERLAAYDEPFVEEEVQGWSMWSLLVVLGCKVGGYPTWTQPPAWPECPTCERRLNHVLTLLGDEGGRHQIPVEEWDTAGYTGGVDEAMAGSEAAHANRHPLEMTFGDNGGFNVFTCTHCPDMPLAASWDSC